MLAPIVVAKYNHFTMSRRKTTLTPADFVAAGVEFVDEHGLEAMTMRALGDKMGVDATALYRHFPNKDSLINAMGEWLMGEVLDNRPDEKTNPRDNLVALALTTRTIFRRHPQIGIALINSDGGGGLKGRDVVMLTIGGLREMGLAGSDLIRAYQSLEGYVMGSCVQDFAGSPHNFAIRRARYRALEDAEFDAVATSDEAVARIADDAFLLGLNALIDRCVALASERRASA